MLAETERAAPQAPPPVEQRNPWEEPRGPLAFMALISNQELGKAFMLTALIFFLLAGIMALLMRTQLAVPENRFLGPQVYNQLFTMHGSTMMYLVVVPFLEGLGIYLLPMLIGSRDVAYPYISAFSYWTYLFGGLCFYGSFLLGSVPAVGWFAYTPLSSAGYSGTGTDFWALTLTLVAFGDLAAGAGLAVTVLRLRAPGMSINRMPLFAWAWLVTGVMITFSFTTLANISTLMLPVDRAIGTHFFDPSHGGSTLLWQHLFWFFGHPEVYIMFIPATGIVSAVVPVFARRPIVAYTLLATAIVLTAFVSFGLWVHHMFATGLPWLSMCFFTAASLMIALASGTQVFAWIATLWGTRPELKVPLLYMLAFVLLFVLGGLTGVMIAIVPFDLQVHDTYFLVAHFHYVLIGGVVFPTLGGMYYWLPKMTGKLMNPRLGYCSFWLTFIGFNVTFFPMHVAGFLGMPRRVYTYAPHLGLDGLNLTETIGAYVLGLGFALFVIDVLLSIRSGPSAGRDPWVGDTLEWLLDSPAPPDNFRVPPVVHGRHPLWVGKSPAEGNEKEERIRRALAEAPKGWRIALSTSVLNAEPEGLLPWPRPRYVPFVVSVALTIFLLGTIFKSMPMMVAGGVVTIIGSFLWYRPDDELLEVLREAGIDKKAGLPLLVTGPATMDWWGLIFCLAVLGTVFGNFLYSYYYIRLYSPVWPQDHLPRPELLWSGIRYALLLASAGFLAAAQRAFKQRKAFAVWAGLAAGFVATAGFLAMEGFALTRVGFSLKTNAYGSLFFVMSWLMDFTALVALASNLGAQARVVKQGTDEMQYVALQVERSAVIAYFAAAAGVVLWVTLYLSPRF